MSQPFAVQGFAGDDLPRCYRPSLVGTVHGAQPAHYFDLSQPREDMRVDSCADPSGLISDWELLEKLLGYAQTHYLKIDFADTPMVVAEKPFTTPKLRHRMCELFFEKLSLPGLFLSKDAVLSCFACGKTTGLVVDVGASGTVVTPVLDGWAEARSCMQSPVGGRLMDSYLYGLVKKRKGSAPDAFYKLARSLDPVNGLVIQRRNLGRITASYEALMNLELARDLKETVCRMADAPLSETSGRYSSIPTAPYELPDGTIIDMGIERFMVPELLCLPASAEAMEGAHPGSSGESVPRIALEAAQRCEVDVHSALYANLVLTGGGSCFEGLPERLKAEVEALVHPFAPQSKVRVVAAGTGERGICAWLGGSILGSLGAFNEMWLTKREYEEFGPQLVDRKCP